MKKITDERLVLKNLQNIKIAYIVQTIGILAILGYDCYKGGVAAMRENPLWLVFMATAVVSAYLSMNVSVAHEKEIQTPRKSLLISIAVLTAIAAVIAFLVSITPGFGWKDSFLIGGILFICGLIPVIYVYRLRVKEQEDLED